MTIKHGVPGCHRCIRINWLTSLMVKLQLNKVKTVKTADLCLRFTTIRAEIGKKCDYHLQWFAALLAAGPILDDSETLRRA